MRAEANTYAHSLLVYVYVYENSKNQKDDITYSSTLTLQRCAA